MVPAKVVGTHYSVAAKVVDTHTEHWVMSFILICRLALPGP